MKQEAVLKQEAGLKQETASFSPKIARKGLLLVLIPFILNILWIGLLSNTLATTAQLAEMERSQSLLVEQVNTLMENYFEANADMLAYLATADEDRRKLGLEKVEVFKEKFAYLRKVTALEPGQISSLTAIIEFFDQQFRNPDVRPETFSENWLNIVRNRKQLSKMMRRTLHDKSAFPDYFAPQKRALEEVRLKQARSRNAVNEVVAAGVVANLLLAAILLYAFVKDFSARLKILVDNARRLSKRTPLNALISGSDELSYLDSAMHGAAADLKNAFEYRQSLMQMVAHDLRSPLAASQVSLEILEDRIKDIVGESDLKQIERVRSNNKRLLALINDLLTIDSLEMGKMELTFSNCSIRDIAEESIQTLLGLAGAKKIEIENDCANEIISADNRRLQQVLVNYLSNAIKFSPSKSKIRFTTRKESTSKIIVSVIDEGIGMKPEDCNLVFDKFYQSADGSKSEGFGLGLAICKLIIASHGGEVGVISEPGKGSSFWFSTRLAP